MKTDEVETTWNSLRGETEKSFFWSGKSLALNMHEQFVKQAWMFMMNRFENSAERIMKEP